MDEQRTHDRATCADACEASGLELAPLPAHIQERLSVSLPPEASLGNPVDMIATATAEQYRRAISTLAAWDGIDALVVIFGRPLLIKPEDVAEAVTEAVQELPREIPVQAVFMSTQDRAAMIRKGGVPTWRIRFALRPEVSERFDGALRDPRCDQRAARVPWDGVLTHIAGVEEQTGMHVVDVWESEEADPWA